MQYMDHYKTLGVSRQASADSIKTAYRKLARRYHPDVSKEPEAEARFKEVTEAYETLRDPQRRNAYDRLDNRRPNFRKPPPESRKTGRDTGGMAGTFFKNLFGGARAERRTSRVFGDATDRRKRTTGAGQQITVTISLEEAYRGTTRDVAVPTGPRDPHARTLRVRIPPGVQSGQQIRLADRTRGDLYLKITIAPHRLFRIDGRDIHLDLPVAPWEAALGASVQVPTLSGPVELRIPPGSQSGRQLRLKGRGLAGEPTGDQYILLQIVTPPADNPDLRELYEKLRSRSRFNPREALG
jgi:curved DNA-binding protein